MERYRRHLPKAAIFIACASLVWRTLAFSQREGVTSAPLASDIIGFEIHREGGVLSPPDCPCRPRVPQRVGVRVRVRVRIRVGASVGSRPTSKIQVGLRRCAVNLLSPSPKRSPHFSARCRTRIPSYKLLTPKADHDLGNLDHIDNLCILYNTVYSRYCICRYKMLGKVCA